jgi:protein-S-isoprenylcysteine O-methyltransferase Ste14
VDPDETVVSTGPYKWIRHPAYSGLILIVAGFGLAWGNWLSFAVCAVLPLPAVLWRIHIEEAELNRVLGDAYGTYQMRTARFVPWPW